MIRRSEFLALEARGLSAQQIAWKLNVTRRTVIRWRAAEGIQHRPRSVRRPDADRERARRLLEDGAAIVEVAASVGVAPATVRRWFPSIGGWSKQQVGEYTALRRRCGVSA